MRRNLLLTFALAASSVAFAQTNLALTGTATATSGKDKAGWAIDDNEGTRWEAPVADFAENEDVSWSLDLGSVQTFNTIQIKWEGAYSKSFVISVSKNGQDYTDVVTKTDEMLTDLLQNYSFDEVSARYIKFQNVARATQWGVSFWEFRVFNMDAATLTSIELTSQATVAKVGTGVMLTATGKDQLGGAMDAGEMTFEVTPAEMGSVAGGVYTPAKAGEATIVAKSGDITSNEVKITAYAGDKIDIFTNLTAMVTPLGEGTKTESKVGAFDDNMGSVWELHGGTGGSEEERTYDTGFTVDLQSLYDITALSVTFEGACPADYAISFAGNDDEFGNAHEVTGHAGMAKFTDFFMPENATEIRYIKFLSTKAATQYGVKIFDFSVYGENKQDIPDTEAPTDFTAVVAEGSATISSVALKLQAADNVSSVITYEISYNKEGEDAKTATASGASGAETTYVLGGLDAKATYNISVVAKDAKGNAADAIVLTATTKAMPKAAPVPEADVANVMSVYSDKYGNADGFSLPNWEEATITNEIELEPNDKSLILSNMTYRGLEFTMMDVSKMEYLHVDVYPETANTVTVTPIWRNIDNNGNYAEKAYAIPDLKAGEWNSIDIPMTAFASDDRNGTNNVYQIKLDNGQNGTFIFDNIYFYKSGVEDTEAPVWVSAEATTVADKTAVITVKATDNNENGMLTYTVRGSETVMATKTAKAGEETAIEISGLTPETEYSLTVSVKDGADNEADDTKTVVFTTTKKIEQPTSGEGSIIVRNSVITEPQTLRYTWNIVQNKTTVVLTIKVTDDTEVTGLIKNANIDTWTNGVANAEANNVLTYTWENVAVGDVLKAKIWWAVAGGRAETTEEISYTIEDIEIVTAISNINAEASAKNGAIYNLAGQRVSKATKGVFIINGKKVIVK